MNEEELQRDILFQIDMQLYDEFNDKFCEMNENLGTIYTYKDIDELEKLEKETEIKLLRKAIINQQSKIKELKEFYIKNYLNRNITLIPLNNLVKNINILLGE